MKRIEKKTSDYGRRLGGSYTYVTRNIETVFGRTKRRQAWEEVKEIKVQKQTA